MGCRASKEEAKEVTASGQGETDDVLRHIDHRLRTVLLLGMSVSSPFNCSIIQRKGLSQRKHLLNNDLMGLIGLPCSGKSTLLKQLRLFHTDGYPIAERQSFRGCVLSNAIQATRTVLENMKSLDFVSEDPALSSHVQTILGLPTEVERDVVPPAVSCALVALSENDEVQKCFARLLEVTPSDSSV